MTLDLTDAVRRALEAEREAGQVLRIAFAGGCGAPGFRLATARRPLTDDRPIGVGSGLTLWLDPRAVRELDGARLDFARDRGFLLDHASWGTSC